MSLHHYLKNIWSSPNIFLMFLNTLCHLFVTTQHPPNMSPRSHNELSIFPLSPPKTKIKSWLPPNIYLTLSNTSSCFPNVIQHPPLVSLVPPNVLGFPSSSLGKKIHDVPHHFLNTIAKTLYHFPNMSNISLTLLKAHVVTQMFFSLTSPSIISPSFELVPMPFQA